MRRYASELLIFSIRSDSSVPIECWLQIFGLSPWKQECLIESELERQLSELRVGVGIGAAAGTLAEVSLRLCDTALSRP